jgi:hypothetical protein
MRRPVIFLALVITATLAVPVVAGAASTSGYQKGLVTVKDLPAGWTAATADTSGDDAAAKDISACVGKPVVKKKKVYTGDDITDPTGSFMVASSVAVYSSAAAAKQQFKVFQSPKYADCAKKHFETTPVGGDGGPLPTSVITDEVDLDPYGDRSVAYAAHAVIPNSDGTSLQVTSIQAAVLRGKAIVRYQFNSAGDSVFDQQTGETILATLDKRLDKAKL